MAEDTEQQQDKDAGKPDDGTAERDQFQKAQEEAKERMDEFEKQDDLPSDLKDWPDGKAKYITFGGEEDDPYGEGISRKLGPAAVTHHDDGSVSVEGKKVDNPEDYKGEPIPLALETEIAKEKEGRGESSSQSQKPEGEKAQDSAEGGDEDGSASKRSAQDS